MIGIAALVIGIVLGLVFHPDVPEFVQPYLPIAVVAALDAVFGGLRAYLERIFDSKVFVVSFVFNVLVAALIVFVGDQLGVGTQLSTAIIVVLGIRIFGNAAALRRRLFGACSTGNGEDQPPQHSTEPDHHGRHELPPDAPPPEIGELHADGVAGVGAARAVADHLRRIGGAVVRPVGHRDRDPGTADGIR